MSNKIFRPNFLIGHVRNTKLYRLQTRKYSFKLEEEDDADEGYPPLTPRDNRFYKPIHLQLLFDRISLGYQKEMNGRLPTDEYEYLREEVAENIVDRLKYITKRFPTVCEIGAHKNFIYNKIDPKMHGIERYFIVESQRSLLYHHDDVVKFDKVHRVLADEEALPFKNEKFDLVISAHSLHYTNDLPGVLRKISQMLKPDGAFIGAIYGGSTLQELRDVLLIAEQEREGGVSPHVIPMTGIRDMGNLIQSMGLNLSTVDSETYQVYYPDMWTLMDHIKLMGEQNCLLERRSMVSRETFVAAAALYQEIYGTDKGIPATFEVIYFIGWKPDPSQPKPKRRGSAEISLQELAQFFGTEVHTITEEGEEEYDKKFEEFIKKKKSENIKRDEDDKTSLF